MTRTFAWLATVLTLGTCAGVVPARAAGAVPPPLFTWTGFYVGGQVGAAWQSDRLVEVQPAACPGNCYDRATGRPGSLLLGVHAGYSVQTGAFVWGLEGDVESARLRHATIYPLSAPDTFGARIGWQGSLRGRLGYAWGDSLFYVTGGAAFADIRHTYVEATSGASQSFSTLRTGWTLGGGVEHALSARWTARVEYRYTDFGRRTESPAIVFPGFIENHRETQQSIRVGLSYRL